MKPGESFVRQPVRSLQTMLRVIGKTDASLPTVIPDGIYGPATMQAVSSFQRNNGLGVTGVVNQDTWDKIVEVYEIAVIEIENAESIEILIENGKVFRKGDSSPYIYILQAMLMHLSDVTPMIERPSCTGVIDEATESALIGFQKISGLKPTGEFNKATWKHLAKQFTLSVNRTD